MSRSGSRRQERKEQTRRELLAAAIHVFAERGFHDASLQEIAAAAGYTTGAIYWHFKNKDELFLGAFEAFAITRVGELEAALQGRTLSKRARGPADQWMARQRTDPTFLVVAIEFLAHAWRHPELRPAFATRAAAVRLATGRFIEQEARAAGVELPMTPEEIGTVMRELGVGLALAKLVDPDAFPDRLHGDFVELFFELATANQERDNRTSGARRTATSRGE